MIASKPHPRSEQEGGFRKIEPSVAPECPGLSHCHGAPWCVTAISQFYELGFGVVIVTHIEDRVSILRRDPFHDHGDLPTAGAVGVVSIPI
jgi:hypothetical protein